MEYGYFHRITYGEGVGKNILGRGGSTIRYGVALATPNYSPFLSSYT